MLRHLHPADDLVGMTTWQVEQTLDDLGECLSIGPAGENGIASLPADGRRRAAGRGGTGASLASNASRRSRSSEQGSGRRHALRRRFLARRRHQGTAKRNGQATEVRPLLRLWYQPWPALRENGRATANYSSTDAQIPDLSALKVGGGAGGQTPEAVAEGAQAVPVVPSMSTHKLSGNTGMNPCPTPSNRAVPCPIAQAKRPTAPPWTA